MSLVGYDSIISKFNNKVDKESGKGLSTNDYTNADKDKVDKIITTGTGTTFLSDNGTYKTIVIPESNGVQDVQYDGVSVVDVLGVANIHRVASTGNYNDLINIPTNLVKDSNYVHTDENFTNTYKLLLNRLVIDGDGTKFLSDDGTYIQLATVAKTGSYNDLTDVPNNIVTDANYVHTDNNFTTTLKTKLENMNSDGEANRINSISLNNNPLTIDSSKNVNIDLTAYALAANIPTKTSQLTNDSNFVSDANYVHTDNNFTTTLKNKLNGIATDAQVNKIEIVKVDGNPLVINSADKSVNIALAGYASTDSVEDLEKRVTNNETNIKSLQMSGLWRGLFNTYADLPTNAKTNGSSFIGGTVYVNDYVIIKEDETHLDASGKPCKTRYYATAIADDGTITWTYFDKEEGSIATATNTSLGLVKGTTYNSTDETTIGKISVATDGTMSVNGIDDLVGQYIPLKGNTKSTPITGSIHFSHITGTSTNPDLIWDEGGAHQKIHVVDSSISGDNLFEFQFSKDSGANYSTLTSIDNTGNIKSLGGIYLHNDSNARMVLGGGTGKYTWIDHRNSDNNVLSGMTLHDNGVANFPKARLGLGTYDSTNDNPKSEIKYNSSEQCIEFIFN